MAAPVKASHEVMAGETARPEIYNYDRMVYLTNKSGGSVTSGDVVIVDTSNARSFTTTNSAGNVLVLGVVAYSYNVATDVVAAQTIANDAAGWIQIAGEAYVKCKDGVAKGNWVKTDTTVKQVVAAASSGERGVFGVALENRDGTSGMARCALIRPTAFTAVTSAILNETVQRTGTGAGDWTAIPSLTVSIVTTVTCTILAWASFKKTQSGGTGPGTTRIVVDGTPGQEDFLNTEHITLIGRKANVAAGTIIVHLEHNGADANHSSTYNRTTILVEATPEV